VDLEFEIIAIGSRDSVPSFHAVAGCASASASKPPFLDLVVIVVEFPISFAPPLLPPPLDCLKPLAYPFPSLSPPFAPELPSHRLLLNNGFIAGAETAISETNVSRTPQIVELPIWDVAARVRMQRSKAVVMTNKPEERRRLMMSFRRRELDFYQEREEDRED
jgi:hypothetical protein